MARCWHAIPHRLEGHGDHCGGEDGQAQVPLVSDAGADPHHDPDVYRGDERCQKRVDHGLVDDDVEVVQTVLEDGDRARRRDPHRQDEDHGPEAQVPDQVARITLVGEEARQDHGQHERTQEGHAHERKQLHLLALVASAASEPYHQRRTCQERSPQDGEAGDPREGLDDASQGIEPDRIDHIDLLDVGKGSRHPARSQGECHGSDGRGGDGQPERGTPAP